MKPAPDLAEFHDEASELEARRNFMIRRGYRFCQIAACNCGSWHGGKAEDRLAEITDMLIDMGVEMNGIVLIDAIQELALTAGYSNDHHQSHHHHRN